MTGSGVGYTAAFGGGVVSFLSPCVLPLVPAYLSVVTGLEIGQITTGMKRHALRITRDTGLFVLGFSVVFVLLGLTATAAGRSLAAHQLTLTRMSGVLVFGFAVFLLGSLVLHAPWLYQERRFHPRLSRYGVFAAPLAGAAFGFGWTPCIGPILGSVLAVAATQQNTAHGAALLAAYSAGLGVPFLATGLAFGRLTGAFGRVKRHFTALTALSAGSLAVFGALLALDRLTLITSTLQDALRQVGLERLIFLG